MYSRVWKGLHTVPPQVETAQVQLVNQAGIQKVTRFLPRTPAIFSRQGGWPRGQPQTGGRAGLEPGGRKAGLSRVILNESTLAPNLNLNTFSDLEITS